MKETEIKGIIPDEPALKSESKREITVTAEEQKKPPQAEKPAASAKPARVRSRWLSAAAAVLALAVTAGGVLAYLGGAKNIGPLASVMHGAESLTESSDAVPDTYTDVMHAKLIFTTFYGYCADMISEGKASKIPTGTFTYDLSDISEAEPAVFRGMLEQLVTDESLTGQIAFRISSAYKPLWAQWRAGDGAYVAQYPEPADGLTFGQGAGSWDDDIEEGKLSAELSEFSAELSSSEMRLVGTGAITIDEDAAAKAAEEYQQTNMTVTPDESKPKLYGTFYSIRFEYDGKAYEIRSSDRQDAPIIINGEYCSCPAAEKLLFDYGIKEELDSHISIYKAEGVLTYSSADTHDLAGSFSMEDRAEEIISWYEAFLAAGYQPAENVGSEIYADATKCIRLSFNGKLVTIVNTKYSAANVQVNGKYYSVPDISVFDSMEECAEAAKARAEAELNELRSQLDTESSNNEQ